MERITKDKLKTVLACVVKSMDDAKDELIALDGSMGDGDLGLTMSKGFHAVHDEFDAITADETDMGKIFMKLGMKMNSVVPSTMGTLIATCFLKAAPAAKGKTVLTLTDLALMGRGAVTGVMERGQTKIGDKTMLDALNPAVEALESAAAAKDTLALAHQRAYKAAIQGVENTKSMQSVHGRAAYYSEQSIGRQDPGATAVMYIFRGLAAGYEQ